MQVCLPPLVSVREGKEGRKERRRKRSRWWVVVVLCLQIAGVPVRSCTRTSTCEGRDEAMASRGQIFGGRIEVLKEYNLWLFLGL